MQQKTILLENGFDIDIPKELIELLKRKKIAWEWKDARFLFWKENREATIKYFTELPEGQNLICSTVFDGYAQLELFINLFHSLLHKKFTFKIMHGNLANDLAKWFDNDEADITPNTDEYNDSWKKRVQFKKDLNKKFREVLKAHRIIWIISRYSGHTMRLKTVADCRHGIDKKLKSK